MTANAPRSAVVATGLRKSFDDHMAFDGIDVDVAEGTLFALLRPERLRQDHDCPDPVHLLAADASTVRVAGHDLDTEPDLVRAVIGVSGRFSGGQPAHRRGEIETKEKRVMMQHQTDGRHHEAAAVSAPPMGRLYDVGGRRLFLHRSGSGGPAVVFLPGGSAVGLDYLNIHDWVSEFTTSVLYDRAGTVWSDRVELPRTAAEVAAELRNLLHAADAPAPYVFVAHSLGGAYVHRFAQLFPDEVAGLLWLNAFHKDWDAYMPEHLHLTRTRQPEPGRLQLWLVRPFARRLYTRMLAEWPEGIRELLIDRHLDPEWLRIGAQERRNLAELRDELQHGGDLPDVPLIALTALGVDSGQALFMSRKALRELSDGKRRLDTALADSVSRGEHRALEDARHSTIHTDRPDAVIQAIRDLLGRVEK